MWVFVTGPAVVQELLGSSFSGQGGARSGPATQAVVLVGVGARLPIDGRRATTHPAHLRLHLNSGFGGGWSRPPLCRSTATQQAAPTVEQPTAGLIANRAYLGIKPAPVFIGKWKQSTTTSFA